MQISYTESGTVLWTPELEGHLKSLISDKIAFSRIAGMFGTTKNAIAGKARRLGIVSLVRAEQLKGKKPRAWTRHSSRPPEPEFNFGAAPVSRNLTIVELGAHECHFIAGLDQRYCGHPVRTNAKGEPNSPYCEHHHGVVYVRR